MKNIVIVLSMGVLLILTGCVYDELCYLNHDATIHVINHWDDETVKPTQGMRLNLYGMPDKSHFTTEDLPTDGGQIYLPANSQFMGVSYDYHESEHIGFRNESDGDAIEAYSATMKRGTYSKSFPSENTVIEPYRLYVDKVDLFETVDETTDGTIDFYPKDVVKTYTFEVRRVYDAKYITDTRGAISGVSASYFLTKERLGSDISTLLFDAQKDAETDRVIGSFRTFGFNATNNIMTIEILYPSYGEGIMQLSWDVSDQIAEGRTHIIVDANIHIVPDPVDSGFDADVEAWGDEEIVPIEV